MSDNPAEITRGSRVSLHFSLGMTDGTEAVSTFGEEPSSIVVGDGSLVPGLELALYGLKAGDRQTLTLEPEQAFGPRSSDKIHYMPRADFAPEMALEPGLVIGFETPGGDEVAGIVLAVEESRVKVDFNHPLAGRQVVFRVEILAVEPPIDPHRAAGAEGE